MSPMDGGASLAQIDSGGSAMPTLRRFLGVSRGMAEWLLVVVREKPFTARDIRPAFAASRWYSEGPPIRVSVVVLDRVFMPR